MKIDFVLLAMQVRTSVLPVPEKNQWNKKVVKEDVEIFNYE
jgi:hypothetical protein